jgi:hypothetical protein
VPPVEPALPASATDPAASEPAPIEHATEAPGASAPAPAPVPAAPPPTNLERVPAPARVPPDLDWNWPKSDRPTSGPQPHTGFYLRFHLGLGLWRAEFAPDPSGGGIGLGIAAGASLTEEVVVFAELDHMARSEDDNVRATLYGIGVGYWLLGPNVYVAGTVGTGSARAETDAPRFEVRSEEGFNAKLMFGKEWLIGHSWGVGGALILRHGSYDMGAFNALGVVASGTYH